jgi:hypothetical protein
MTFPKTLTSFTKRPYWWVYVAGAAVLIITLCVWWAKVYMSPERVFWGMLHNSLSTSGYTLDISQESSQGSVRQLVQVDVGNTDRAHLLSTVSQPGTTIQTEIIGTRDTDFARYRSIDTDQKNAQGKEIDLSDVENVWSKSTGKGDGADSGGNQLLAQGLLGIPFGTFPVPVGKVSPESRDRLLRDIRDQGTYEVSFKDVKRKTRDGRQVYEYDVKIQTILYVRLMKEFAKDLGLHELDDIDPNTYQGTPALKFKLIVDPRARQLVAVENGQQGFKQEYSGYGLQLRVNLPKDAITTAELQRRLSEL